MLCPDGRSVGQPRDNLPVGFTDRTRLIQSWLVCTFGGLLGSASAASDVARYLTPAAGRTASLLFAVEIAALDCLRTCNIGHRKYTAVVSLEKSMI